MADTTDDLGELEDLTELGQADLEESDKEESDDSADNAESEEEPSEEEEPTEEEPEEKPEEEEEEELDDEGKPKPKKVKTQEEELAEGKLAFKQIKEKYPNLFKDFPQLRHAFFREQEYSKVFPTIEDAKEAHLKSQNFDFLESDLMQGHSGNLLVTIAKANPESFSTLVQNFLPTVHHISKDAFYEITQPLILQAVKAAFKEGKDTGNKNLMWGAQYVNRFLFGKTDFEEEPTKTTAPDPEKIKFEKERDEFIKGRTLEFETSTNTATRDEMINLVKEGLDPQGELTEFTRKKIIEETIGRIGSVLEKDSRHIALMNSLWKRAMQGGLTPEFRARITQAYIARAKEILPTIRAKVRAEAMGKKIVPNNPKRLSGGGEAKGEQPLNPKKIDWRKTSDLDILNGKPTFKK